MEYNHRECIHLVLFNVMVSIPYFTVMHMPANGYCFEVRSVLTKFAMRVRQFLFTLSYFPSVCSVLPPLDVEIFDRFS